MSRKDFGVAHGPLQGLIVQMSSPARQHVRDLLPMGAAAALGSMPTTETSKYGWSLSAATRGAADCNRDRHACDALRAAAVGLGAFDHASSSSAASTVLSQMSAGVFDQIKQLSASSAMDSWTSLHGVRTSMLHSRLDSDLLAGFGDLASRTRRAIADDVGHLTAMSTLSRPVAEAAQDVFGWASSRDRSRLEAEVGFQGSDTRETRAHESGGALRSQSPIGLVAAAHAHPHRKSTSLPPLEIALTFHGRWNLLEQDELQAKLEEFPDFLPCSCDPCELLACKVIAVLEGGDPLLTLKLACQLCGEVKEKLRWDTFISAERGVRLVTPP
jgi:hypothetical protein